MAPNVTVSFWDPYDINGTPIHTVDDEDPNFKGLTLKPDLNGLGGWELTLSREWAYGLLNDQAARGDVFVRFLISAYSDTEWYWGGLLDKRQITVVHKDELGAEEFILGGSGPKRYLDRFRLGIERNTPSGWKLDLANGVWRWGENATAGSVLRKLITEDQNTDPPSLVDLTASFTASDDSNSDAWTEEVADADGNFELPIGTSLLEALFDLEDIGDLVTTVHLGTVASPLYRLDAWQTYGEDVTGSAFGTGVGLLREGDNIANDALTVAGVLMKKATHVIIEGKDGVWAKKVLPAWSPGDYVRWAKIEYTRSSNVPTLQRAGLRWLRRQDNGDKQLEVEIVPGADDTQGFYFPSPSSPIWLGNTVTVDTVADGSEHSPMDYNEADALVTGLELKLAQAGSDASADLKAKSWEIKVKLNGERAGYANSPNQSSASSGPGNGGGGGCKCIKLCHEAIPADDASVDQFLNANDPGGTNPDWQGLLGNQGGSGSGANGTDWYNFKSAGSASKYQHSRACTVGQTITVSGWWGCRSDGHVILTFTTAPAGSASATIQAAVISTEDLHIDGPGHSHNPQEWTAFSQSYTVPATTVSYALGHSGDDINFDEVTVSLGSAIPAEDVLAGTDGNAARCDHQHHQISEDDPTVDDDETLGYRVGTIWLTVDDADNPTALTAMWMLLDATDGAAVWEDITPGGGSGNVATDAIWDAKGDLAVGTGADTADNLAVGANDTILMADSGQTTGLKWVASQTPSTQAFGDSAAEGTADTYARGDHKHGMPASPSASIIVQENDSTVDAAATTLDFGTGLDVTSSPAGEANIVVDPSEIALDTLGATSDNTTLDSSTSAHGLLRKLDNNSSHFLNGQGGWTSPSAAAGGVDTSASYTPALTTAGAGADPNLGSTGTAYGRYAQIGADKLWLVIYFEFLGTGISAGSGNYQASLPGGFTSATGPVQSAPLYMLDSGSQHKVGTAIITSASTLFDMVHTSSTNAGIISNSVPHTWASGDRIVIGPVILQL